MRGCLQNQKHPRQNGREHYVCVAMWEVHSEVVWTNPNSQETRAKRSILGIAMRAMSQPQLRQLTNANSQAGRSYGTRHNQTKKTQTVCTSGKFKEGRTHKILQIAICRDCEHQGVETDIKERSDAQQNHSSVSSTKCEERRAHHAGKRRRNPGKNVT